MFIGHYGPAFAAKPIQKSVPLWLLFVAVQWMDFCWSVLVLLGVEKVRIIPGFTQGSTLDLYYMPYTHGLIGASILALVSGVVAAQFFGNRKTLTAAVVAGAVFSHWLLDLVVHVPDLPLIGDHMKVGFGLWRHVAISLPLEIITLFIGAWIYDRNRPGKKGRAIFWVFIVAMAAVQAGTQFMVVRSGQEEAITALVAYLLLAALAGGVEAVRK